jgi:PGF-CTERM protein
MSRLLVSVVTTVLVVAALAPGAIGGAAADDVTLTVTVVDSDGETLGNIPLSVTWDDGNGGPINQTTAPNGQALFGVPDGADVQIYINDDQYMRNFPYTVENVTDQSVEVPVSLSGQATVTVEDASGPVENANVWVFRDARYVDTRQTGPDGTSTTAPLERGGYGLEVRKAGYVTNKTSLSIGPGTNNKTVQIRRGTVEMQFNVTDDTFATPQPIENATVNIQGGASLPTLSNGFASTTVAVNREYTVTVSKDGYESVTRTIQVGEQRTMLNVSIRRTDAISIEAANDRVVVGESTQVTVTDEYGERVAGATVSAGDSTVGETDANGQLTVPIDAAGNTTITVETDGLSASTVVEGVEPASNEPTATVTQTDTPTTTETPGDSGPGFGIVSALVALVAILLVARRR